MSLIEDGREDRERLNTEQENGNETAERASANWDKDIIELNNKMETADSNTQFRPTKRNRAVEEEEEQEEDKNELEWTTVEKKGKKVNYRDNNFKLSNKSCLSNSRLQSYLQVLI